MTERIPPDILRKVHKLAQLPDEARQCQYALNVTRLTILKSLCKQPDVANRFVAFLARKVLERVEQGKGRASRTKDALNLTNYGLMSEALIGMEAWHQEPTEELRQSLWDLYRRMTEVQNEHKRIHSVAVRQIMDWELFQCEQALACILHPHESGFRAYMMARDYAERYDPRHGTGLTPESAPLLQDIADFWSLEVGIRRRD